MVHGAVVPDSEIIDIAPLVTNLEVMVLDNELHKPGQEMLGLLLREPIDLLDVRADGENTLPSGHRIGADDRMDRLEELADILGCSSFTAEELEAIAVCRFVETGLCVSSCQGVEEPSKGWRDAIIQLVTGRPQSVYRCD